MNRRTMWPAYFSVDRQDVEDGPGNTIHLVENLTSNVVWMEPREMRERDLLALLPTDNPSKHNVLPSLRACILLVDGTCRFISTSIPTKLLRSMLTPRHGQPMVLDDQWPPDLLVDDLIEPGDAPPLKDLSQFPGTRVLSAPDGLIDSNQTALYCAVQQITWDQLRSEPTSPVYVATPSPVTEYLNRHPFPIGALAQDCYFAGVAGLGLAASDDLSEQLRHRFPHAQAELLPNRHETSGIRILVYLEKSLPFPEVMRRFPEPLPFIGGPHALAVESFGWYCDHSQSVSDFQADFPVLTETVRIRDYVSDDDFVIALNSVSRQGDEIILARITPRETLQATWETTAGRLRTPLGNHVEPQLQPEDRLQIPLLAIGVTAEMTELVELAVPTAEHPDRFIADCRQTIRFRLDERGAELVCAEQMVVNDGEFTTDKAKPRHLVFDRPFLLALKERNADTPYFLAWIANSELMLRTK